MRLAVVMPGACPWFLLPRPHDRENDFTGVGSAAVFEEVESLPGAEKEPALRDRYALRGARERHADVADNGVPPEHGVS